MVHRICSSRKALFEKENLFSTDLALFLRKSSLSNDSSQRRRLSNAQLKYIADDEPCLSQALKQGVSFGIVSLKKKYLKLNKSPCVKTEAAFCCNWCWLEYRK